MKKFYNILNKKVKDAIETCGYELDDVKVNESNRPDLGEYQFNDAFLLAKSYHKSPMIIASEIVNELSKNDFFKNVSVANPGFINMTISDKGLIDFFNIDDYAYEKNNKLIFLDYGGANVAKSLHVGHLRSTNIGEALNRLCNYLGYNTISDTHLGDWGRPLGLVILEYSKRHPEWKFFDKNYEGEYEKIGITNAELEEIYPYASALAKQDEEYLKEAQEMTKRLQNKEKGIYDLWLQIMDVSKNDIHNIYDRLNANFDLYKGESDAEEYIPKLLEYLNNLDIVEESEGAKVIDVSEDTDQSDVPPMLLIKSDGGMLYSTTEMATLYERLEKYHPDEVWYVVDKRQELHFTQVFRATKKANLITHEKLEFIGFGTMNGKDNKPFKTRDGGVMRLVDLIEDVKKECLKRLNENITESRDEIAEKLAISTIKFADLLPNRESDYIFDIDKFCALEGKTGPYILYSTIRMKSLLNKAQEANIKYDKLTLLDSVFDRELLLMLNNFDIVLETSFKNKTLNDIVDYLYKLTNSYNRFYTEHIILKEEDVNKRESWLYLTKRVYDINNILLDILAIEVPDRI